MKVVLWNVVLGVIPTLALAWSIAADERRPREEQTISAEGDRRRHSAVFALIYALWALTLALWNWMSSAPVGWIIAWLAFAVCGFALQRLATTRN